MAMIFARVTIWRFVLLACLVVMTGLSAAAQSARNLKNSGAVGERLDGYLGIVDGSAGGDIRGAVDAINAQRLQAFDGAARDSGRTLSEVEAVAGARLRDKAQAGDWVQNAAGQWILR
jgi:uncharacterized protein YdbL (DUF1318 family)